MQDNSVPDSPGPGRLSRFARVNNYTKGIGLRICLMLLACGLSPIAHAQVFKCSDGKHVVYSDKPCQNAKPIDTTNAAQPSPEDYEMALMRREQLMREAAARAASAQPPANEKKCRRMIRDFNWTVTTARKYHDDQWWQNQVASDREELTRECGNVVIPGGIPIR